MIKGKRGLLKHFRNMCLLGNNAGSSFLISSRDDQRIESRDTRRRPRRSELKF